MVATSSCNLLLLLDLELQHKSTKGSRPSEEEINNPTYYEIIDDDHDCKIPAKELVTCYEEMIIPVGVEPIPEVETEPNPAYTTESQ